MRSMIEGQKPHSGNRDLVRDQRVEGSNPLSTTNVFNNLQSLVESLRLPM